jgi:hypothetical protein
MALNAEQKHILEQMRKGFEAGMQCYFICSLDHDGNANVHGDGNPLLIKEALIAACRVQPGLQQLFKDIGTSVI